jgi:hypothetical protein
MIQKKCKAIHLTPWGAGGRGPVSFQKFVFFYLDSDGGKLYIKIVAFDGSTIL